MPIPHQQSYPKIVQLREGTIVNIRPLERGDEEGLLRFFRHIPEAERNYLKEDVTSPQVIRRWTAKIDPERVIPIVALIDGEIGLGRRLIRELLDIAAELELHKATIELVAQREEPAMRAVESVGFRRVATLKSWVQDPLGGFLDLVVLEAPLKDFKLWWWF